MNIINIKQLLKNKGFTLVETLASLVLLIIILLSFTQIFIQTNDVAKKNNEKLVVINLADGVLEGLKVRPMKEIKTATDAQDYFKISTNPSAPSDSLLLNGKTYKVTYSASQSTTKYKNGFYSEKDLKLMKVVVTVISPNGKTKSSSEGYVSIE